MYAKVCIDRLPVNQCFTTETNQHILTDSIDLRQCLIYDSNEKNARLIGVEFMIPKEKYLTLDEEEQKLW